MNSDKRILIISDTHGREDGIGRLIDLVKPYCLYHLGDSQDDCYNLKTITDKKGILLEAVAGNCDWYSSLPKDLVLNVGESRILMTHGHKYSAKAGLYGLMAAAQDNDCDIVLFGHTHHAFNEESNGIRFFNPGSWSLPYPGEAGSYGVLILRENGSIDLEYRYRDQVGL